MNFSPIYVELQIEVPNITRADCILDEKLHFLLFDRGNIGRNMYPWFF